MDLILGLGLSFLSSAAVVGEERSVTHRVGGTSGDYCSLEAQSCCRRECVRNSCIVLITPIDWIYAAWQTMHPEHIVNSLYLHACKIFAYPPLPSGGREIPNTLGLCDYYYRHHHHYHQQGAHELTCVNHVRYHT